MGDEASPGNETMPLVSGRRHDLSSSACRFCRSLAARAVAYEDRGTAGALADFFFRFAVSLFEDDDDEEVEEDTDSDEESESECTGGFSFVLVLLLRELSGEDSRVITGGALVFGDGGLSGISPSSMSPGDFSVVVDGTASQR